MRAFTLIELLVAVAVMALLSVMLLQIVEQTMRSTGAATRSIEQTGVARRVLDAMESDFLHAVRTGGAAVLIRVNPSPQMDDLAFLTHGRGPLMAGSPADAAPRFLAVSYWWSDLNAGTLWRGYAPTPATASNPLASAALARQGSTYPPTPVALGIVRGLVLFEMSDATITVQPPSTALSTSPGDFHGHSVPSGWSVLRPPVPEPADRTARVRALIIFFATLDDGSLAKLDASGVLAARGALEDPVTQAQMRDLPGFWESALASNSSLPPMAARGFKIFQKRIPLL